MRHILIILSLLISFTIISCSAKDESGSSGSNISMNDLKSNVKNNSTYLTTKDSTSSSRMNKLKQTRNSNKISTSSDSLITFDENGNVDYGLITNHNIKIDQLIQLDSNKSIAIFDYNDSNTWQNLMKLKNRGYSFILTICIIIVALIMIYTISEYLSNYFFST